MKDHIAYLKKVLQHKYYVVLGCREMDVPLWRGLLHDWTKFLPSEWFPYVRNFYNKDGTPKDIRDKKTGGYNPAIQPDVFLSGWLHHQKCNKHHWQYWTVIGDAGDLKPLPIPDLYLREMIADWIGAGLAYSGKSDPVGWYEKTKDRMILEARTRERLELKLKVYFSN